MVSVRDAVSSSGARHLLRRRALFCVGSIAGASRLGLPPDSRAENQKRNVLGLFNNFAEFHRKSGMLIVGAANLGGFRLCRRMACQWRLVVMTVWSLRVQEQCSCKSQLLGAGITVGHFGLCISAWRRRLVSACGNGAGLGGPLA